MHTFTFREKNSWSDYGIITVNYPIVTAPNRKVNYQEVAGRSGTLKFDEKSYQDKTISYNCTTKNISYNTLDSIKTWLYEGGEDKLIMSGSPDKYYKAQVVNSVDFEFTMRAFGAFSVVFNTSPFKYLLNEEINSGNIAINDGGTACQPVITATLSAGGTATIIIKDSLDTTMETMHIDGTGEINDVSLIFDFENMNCYSTEDNSLFSRNRNHLIRGNYSQVPVGGSVTTNGFNSVEILLNKRWL